MGDLLADHADSDRVRPDSAPIRPPSGAGGAPFPEARHRGRKGYTIVCPQTNRKGPLQGLPPRDGPAGSILRTLWRTSGSRAGQSVTGGAVAVACGPAARLPRRPPDGRSGAVSAPAGGASNSSSCCAVDHQTCSGSRSSSAAAARQAAGLIGRSPASRSAHARARPFRAAHHGECCRVPLSRRALPSRAPSRTCSRARAASASRS